MNTPGFTGHDSLYRSNQHYATGLMSRWSPPAMAVPAFKAPPGGGGDCHVECGECGAGCKRTCQNTCLPAPYQESCCDSTERCCSGKCVNTTSDWANCGACGNACASGSCIDGVCQPCLPGLTLCGGGCVDLSADPFNCGACGVKCKTGICCGGTCGTDCGGGYCCQGGYPCCNTPLGRRCCSHKCNRTIFGNFCT